IWRNVRNLVIGRIIGGRAGGIQDHLDFGNAEAGQFHIKVQLDETLEVDSQNFRVPAGLFRKSIVSDYKGAFIVVAEVADAQRRHPFATEQLGSFYAAMSRDDLIAFVD